MTRAQSILVALALALATTGSLRTHAQEVTPGFQGTVNNYPVGMNDEEECRHPPTGQQPACSQWFRFKFQAFTNGVVKAPFRVTNDSWRGYCGAVVFVARDRANPPGNVLGTFRSPTICIDGKGKDTDYLERAADVDWSFTTDPAVGTNGHDLYGYVVRYKDTGLDFLALAKTAGAIILDAKGKVVQIVAACVSIGLCVP